MPLPKAYQGVLAANTPDLIHAAVHAAAQLVLHLTGEQRLTREEKTRLVNILKELVLVAREEGDVRP